MNITEEMIKELAQIPEAREKVKELFPEVFKKGRWVPKYGDTYYTISAWGGAFPALWYNNEHDKYCLSLGLVFRTEEEAKNYIDAMKVHAELKAIAAELNPEGWDGKGEYFHIGLCAVVGVNFACNHNILPVVKFKDSSFVKVVRERIEASRIKNYCENFGR